jgi:two-component system, NarL family, sensor histidine kinase DesK
MAAEQRAAEGIPEQPRTARAAGRRSPQHELVASTGISLRLWRLYAQAWLVCLLFPILALIRLRLALVDLLPVLGGLVIFVACYTWAMWSHPIQSVTRRTVSMRQALPVLAGLTMLVLWLSLAYDSAFLWLLVGVSAMTGVLLPARSAFLAVMILTLMTLGCSIAIAHDIGLVDWLHILPLVLLVRGLGLDMVGLAQLAGALREVHAARHELARLAVIEERLRMARDLHDLLGQTLSMITLKSELAARLAAHDPVRAAQEMHEVEQVARQTLREVRTTVAGERQPTLPGELDSARQVLEAAGIDHTIEQTAETPQAPIDTVLAWVVREGVTNVIRHSRARWCRIRIAAISGKVSAEVTNDGTPVQQLSAEPASGGSGLAGLAGRVTACGGQMRAGRATIDGQAGFRLWVELPIGPKGTAGQEWQP